MRIRTAGVVAALRLALAASGCGGDSARAGRARTTRRPGKLVIWADDKRAAALKPFAEQFGAGERRHGRGPGDLRGPADQLRDRAPAGQRPGHRGRRARLDRQPGPERRHRPGAADRRRRRPPSTGPPLKARHLQRPALRRAVRGGEHGADPQHRAGARTPRRHGGPGRRRQEAQGGRQGQRDHVPRRSARRATPTTSTRCSPRPAATSSAPPRPATTTRRTSAVG